MITRESIRRELEASLAQTEQSAVSIAERAKQAVARDTRLRKVSRYAKDAALFADQGKDADAARALEKAARALFNLPEHA